jgi:type VI secretion system protein ImpC
MSAEQEKTAAASTTEAQGLDYIYQTMNLAVPDHVVDIGGFKNAEALAESKASDRIGAALAFFVDSIVQSSQSVERIDKVVLDNQIAEIDRKISSQLDEVLHHPTFQKMVEKSEISRRSYRFQKKHQNRYS